MMQYLFLAEANTAEASQITQLYRDAGWWDLDGEAPELVQRIVAGSHCFLIACEGADIIGMGRGISDRISDAYIQDVTVRPSHRGRGIGTVIVARLVERLKADGIGWIGLIAEGDSAEFYRRIGFRAMQRATPMINKA